MKFVKKISAIVFFDTYGNLASASFLICAVSGVFLAIPYDVDNAWDSIRSMLLYNQAASFTRNLHYWSAQFFLVLLFLHIWQHFKLYTEKILSPGIWFRLSISILVSLYVMLSGFILKGDAESMQARRILETIIASIPFAGDFLQYSVFGKENSLQLTYVHHIATATIFLIIIIQEHAKRLWTSMPVFLKSLFVLVVVSFLFRAPLHDGYDPVLKGPWYFTGLQEILHLVSGPLPAVLISLLLLTLVFVIKWLNYKASLRVKQLLLLFVYLYLILTIIGVFFRGENWSWQLPWKQESSISISSYWKNLISGPDDIKTTDGIKGESCLICHDAFKGFSPSHDPTAIGCISCHAGDPFSLDKDQAHRSMIRIPGNLSRANRSCGTSACHPQLVERVNNSLMTTCSGMVSVDRFIFNELEKPEGFYHIKNLGQSPADNHLRDLCAGCHLGREKTISGRVSQRSRGGGCIACHLNYKPEARASLDFYNSDVPIDSIRPYFHPSIDVKVTDEHCFGCHSRSGRISTNYQGWHETMYKENSIPADDGESYRVLEDKRVFVYRGADVHFQKGMQCIDCHSSYEIMGDGNLYEHEEDQLKIECEDCHNNEPATMVHFEEAGEDFFKLFGLRNYFNYGDSVLSGAVSGNPIVNAFLNSEGKPVLRGKNSGILFPLRPPSAECSSGTAHNKLECRSCHTSWAPQCIGCHNVYERDAESFDLLDQQYVEGEWSEYAGRFLSDPPALGVVSAKGDPSSKSIGTFVPGMVLSIDMKKYPGHEETQDIFHRLYAPVSSHTIVRNGRECKSCHNDPLALGYGRGEMNYIIEGKNGYWQFIPKFANSKYDDIPEDAWIAFLSEPGKNLSTRTNARPFSVEEQKRILLAGACLTCHDEKSAVIERSLYDFDNLLEEVSAYCILPSWQ